MLVQDLCIKGNSRYDIDVGDGYNIGKGSHFLLFLFYNVLVFGTAFCKVGINQPLIS